jgi:signal peptidase I
MTNHRTGRRWRTACLVSLLCGMAAFLACGFDVVQVSSNSMEDGLHDGDFVLIARAHFAVGEKWRRWVMPRRGQIIIFRVPNDVKTIMIKRTIGVAGDQVRIYRGDLIVDGTSIAEPYVHHQQGYSPETSFWPLDTEGPGLRPITVPASHYFVMGDNREYSEDSRAFGPVPENDVIGVVLFTIHRRGRAKGGPQSVESRPHLS